MDFHTKALEAFADEEYDQALALFTEALQSNPDSSDLLIRRAGCHLKLGKNLEAVTDSNRAIDLDKGNYRAFLIKGEALLNEDEYETALGSVQTAKTLGAPVSRYKPLLDLCTAELEREGGVPAQRGANVDPVGTPINRYPETNGGKTNLANGKDTDAAGPSTAPKESTIGQENAPANAEEAGPAEPLYRHQFFQTQNKVEVAVLAKNLKADQVDVKIEESKLLVVIKDAQGNEVYRLDVLLADCVDPSKSKHEILRSKVEIVLHKSSPVQWAGLEASSGTTLTVAPAAEPQTSTLPYAFKGKPKDWNKLEAEVKQEEKDEKLDGDAGLQKFFQSIYAGADEDTRRAMNKSFQESNGTVLSTDWKDIGSKKTVYKPSS